jgi:hypothetical protein
MAEFVGGLICGAVLMLILFANMITPPSEHARAACTAAGYHDGRFDKTRGFVCLTIADTVLGAK